MEKSKRITRRVIEKPKKGSMPPDDFVGCWTCKHYAAAVCTKYNERRDRSYFCTGYFPKE